MKKATVTLFLTLTCLTAYGAAYGAEKAKTKAAALEAHVRRIEHGLLPGTLIKGAPPATMELVERMRFHKVPGVSIAVIQDGRVEWARGFGVKEAGKSDPVTPETMFQAASISKPITALAALRLVQDGRLNLDEDVNAKLVSWHVPENELTRAQKVTLRRLLSHTAGLTVHGFPGYAADEAVPTLVQVLDGVKPANTAPIRVDILPGLMWRYSGGGYMVVQQLLIDVTKKPFPDLMREKVIAPLGLRHSTYEQPLPASLAAMAATGHEDGQPVKGHWHTYPEMAAAGLWTTPTDLALIAIEIQRALAGRSDKVIAQGTARQMLTPQMEDYGLGPGVEGEGARTRFLHNGKNEGFEAAWMAYETTGQGVVVMANGSGGARLAQEIIRTIASEYGWLDFKPKERALATVDPKIFESYAGTYEFKLSPARTINVVVTTEQGRLYAVLNEAPKEEWLPSSETEFFSTASEPTLQFVKDAQGRFSQLIVDLGGGEAYRGQKKDGAAQ
jgi:CubicO group peptidase (beta-lactamase class C family)